MIFNPGHYHDGTKNYRGSLNEEAMDDTAWQPVSSSAATRSRRNTWHAPLSGGSCSASNGTTLAQTKDGLWSSVLSSQLPFFRLDHDSFIDEVTSSREDNDSYPKPGSKSDISQPGRPDTRSIKPGSKQKASAGKNAANGDGDPGLELPFLDLTPMSISALNTIDANLREVRQIKGLKAIKSLFLSTRDKVQAAEARNTGQKVPVPSLKLDLLITGKPGTGKSKVAKLYAKLLCDMGVVVKDRHNRRRSTYSRTFDDEDDYFSSFMRRLMGEPTNKDTDEEDSFIKYDRSKESYVVITEDVDNLPNFTDPQAVHIVVAGSQKRFASIFEDPRAHARFHRAIINIPETPEDDLLEILVSQLQRKRILVEGGYSSAMLRSFVKQIYDRRTLKDYENINTLLAELKKVYVRLSTRLEQDNPREQAGLVSIAKSSLRITDRDLFGSRPNSAFFEECEAWKTLNAMSGLKNVKDAVRELHTRRLDDYCRGLEGKAPLNTNLNRVFLGPPGTGKTTVAKLYGQVLADLGYVSSGEVVTKTPADFIGQYVGHSEEKTKKILEKTKGKVLVIDEAHMLFHRSETGCDKSDIFRLSVVDTIVATCDNEPGNDRCILLLGYTDRMEEFYLSTNPGFSRRFPLEDAFRFADYEDFTLREILDSMLSEAGLSATDEALRVALEVLRRERNGPNFSNGGAVRNLINRAKAESTKRRETLRVSTVTDVDGIEPELSKAQEVLQPADFDAEFDREKTAGSVVKDAFDGLVGFEKIAGKFAAWQKMNYNMRQLGLDPHEVIPFGFVFKGAPGTGKTTTARALGRLYHAMGFLSTTEVLDCSARELVGEYVGQTGPKVHRLLTKALGKVLLIDEAYRLSARGSNCEASYQREAVAELVDSMTKPRFRNKLIIVLAGYTKEMDGLMESNEGLRGRFPEHLVFPSLNAKQSFELLETKLKDFHIEIARSSWPAEIRDVPRKVLHMFVELEKTPGWANAREIETISKRLMTEVCSKDLSHIQSTLGADGHAILRIEMEDILRCLERTYEERKK